MRQLSFNSFELPLRASARLLSAVCTDTVVRPNCKQESSTHDGVLTAGRRARGAVPDGGQGGIRFEEVSHNLCALHLHLFPPDTANESQKDASRGADSKDAVAYLTSVRVSCVLSIA